MDSRMLVVVLRLVHVLGGIFWVGAAVVNATFLLPAVRDIGGDAMRVVGYIMQRRKMSVWVNIAAALTLLSGFGLYGFFSSGGSGFARSRMGMVLAVGAIAALLAGIIAGAMVGPSAKKLGGLAQRLQDAQRGGAPPQALTAEFAMLQARLLRGVRIAAVLLVFSAAAMAAARYI